MSEQRSKQQGILPAAWDFGEELLLLAEEAAERGGRKHTEIVEMELPAMEDKVYIRFRGAELALPAGTDVEAIAAVLRSLQQL